MRDPDCTVTTVAATQTRDECVEPITYTCVKGHEMLSKSPLGCINAKSRVVTEECLRDTGRRPGEGQSLSTLFLQLPVGLQLPQCKGQNTYTTV